jgi:hypothetical protein
VKPRRRNAALATLSATAALALVAALVVPVLAQGSLSGLGGERLSDSDLAQGTHVFVVWASWSPRSRDVVPRVNAIADRWGGRARVATVSFQEDRGEVEAFLAGKRLAVPVYLDRDGSFCKRYAVATLPGLLIIKGGQVAFRGRLPDDPDRVIASHLE